MELLFEPWFLEKVFRFFTFRRSTSQIRRINYPTGIFHGEVRELEEGGVERSGLGFLYSSRGDMYFGMFEGGEFSGDGNFFFGDGGFLRGGFEAGRLQGPAVLGRANGDVFFLSFDRGALHGPATFFPGGQNRSVVFLFKQNRFQRKVREFRLEEGAEAAKRALAELVFKGEQSPNLLLELRDVLNLVRRLPPETKLLGTFENPEQGVLCSGFFSNKLKSDGLCLFVDKGARTLRFGEFRDSQPHGVCSVFSNGFLFSGGFCDNEMNGKVAVSALKAGKFKLCHYEQGRFLKAVEEGNGAFHGEIFQLSKDSDRPDDVAFDPVPPKMFVFFTDALDCPHPANVDFTQPPPEQLHIHNEDDQANEGNVFDI